MKIIVLFTVLLTSFNILFSQDSDYKLLDRNLKGKVESVFNIEYDKTEKDGKINQIRKGSSLAIFDKSGFIIEKIRFNEEDKLFSRSIYKIENGNLSMITYYDINGRQQKEREIFKHNGSINEIQYINNIGALALVRKLEYNKSNQLIREVKSYPGVETKVITYTYISNKNTDTIIQMEPSGIMEKNKSKSVVKKNAAGDVIEYFDGGYMESFKYNYDYDLQGNWIKKETISPRNIFNKIELRTIIYY